MGKKRYKSMKKIKKKVVQIIIGILIFIVTIIGPQSTLCVEAVSLVRISYNDSLITAVGKQGQNQCLAYALAYCRTILDE